MAHEPKYVTLTDDNFAELVLRSDKPVLVDFWAQWCGPCLRIAPDIEALAEAFDGRAVIGKMDVDHNPKVPMSFNVRSIPTLLFFKDGQVVEQRIGAVARNQLRNILDGLVVQPV